MRTAVLIPARYDSSRLPGKMLLELIGKPLVRHVFDICEQSGYDTYVLTDNDLVAEAVPRFIKTGPAENGTERCCYAMNDLAYDRFINVQGDMPDITVDIIKSVADMLDNYSVSTAYTHMPENKLNDPNTVKLIQTNGLAHWFGRMSVKYGYHHLGVYGYRREMKNIYLTATQHQEERTEKLEQLRWIQNGYKIGCAFVNFDGLEINTAEDLREWHKKNSQ